jgi:hypothetical protein
MQMALAEQKRLHESRISALSSGGVVTEQGVGAVRDDKDRERMAQELVDASCIIREANDLCKALGYSLSFRMAMRISLHGMCVCLCVSVCVCVCLCA